MLKKLKSILKLIFKDETNVSLIRKLDNYFIDNNFEEHKKNIQQLQQLCDWIENLKLDVINNKRNYQEMMYDKMIDKIDDLMSDIRNETLILKTQ